MLYIVYGPDKTCLEYETNLKLKNLGSTNPNHIFYDENPDKIISVISQNNIFDEQSTYVIHDATFLKNPNDPKNIELFKTCVSIESDIVCLVEETKEIEILQFPIEYRKVIELKKVGKFTTISKSKLINELIKESGVCFESLTAKVKFESRVLSDPFFIKNEFEKLVSFANYGNITIEQVEKAVADFSNNNIFNLLTHILNNNKAQSIVLFEWLIETKHQPSELLGLMSTQLFNLKLLKMAFINRMSSVEIEQKLKFSRVQQSINQKLLFNLTLDKINDLLNQITMLDYNIKSNKILPEVGFKLLLLK